MLYRTCMVLSLFALLAVAPLATADDLRYTYKVITIPAPAGSRLPDLTLRGLTNGGLLAGIFYAPGGYSARVLRGQVLPVQCPPEEFTRYQFPFLSGPEVLSMNNDGTVVGDDEGVDGAYGFLQTANGTCTHFRVPGSGYTLAMGVNDRGAAVGFFINPQGQERGLLATHGFLRDAGGFVTLSGPGPRDVVFPTAVNVHGDIVGYLYQDVSPNNEYTYQAFLFRNGRYELIDSPTGEDVWLVDINNRGQILGLLGQPNVGSRPFLLEDGVVFELPLPTSLTRALLPTALNDHGQIVGLAFELPPSGNPPPVAQQVLGTPTRAHRDPDQRPHGHPRPPTRQHMGRLQDVKPEHPKLFVPCLDDDGTPVWSNGTRVMGGRSR
jgi:hypothetical protein